MGDQNKKLKEIIIKTIRFFDFFSFPLSAEKVLFFLPVQCDLSVLRAELDVLTAEGVLGERGGLYFFRGHQGFFDLAEEKRAAAEKKMGRARFVTRIFRLIPWIRMVAVANVMGDGNFRKEGDIDFFIIAKHDRIWLTRLFAVLITDVLRLRPRENDVRDKICLSFFVSDDALDVSGLLLADPDSRHSPIDRDPYFVYWFANLIVIHDDGVYVEFVNRNQWLTKQLPNWQPGQPSRAGSPLAAISFLFDISFGFFEKMAKKLQLRIVPERIRCLEDKGTDVVMNDRVLKFHTNDRRVMYRERMKEGYNP